MALRRNRFRAYVFAPAGTLFFFGQVVLLTFSRRPERASGDEEEEATRDRGGAIKEKKRVGEEMFPMQ